MFIWVWPLLPDAHTGLPTGTPGYSDFMVRQELVGSICGSKVGLVYFDTYFLRLKFKVVDSNPENLSACER